VVNDLLTAITTQLGTTMGDKYHYYVEDVPQKLIKPCFTTDMILPMKRIRNSKLNDRVMPIVVHYFTNDQENAKRDCYSKAEHIMDCLEYLPFKGGLIRGEDMSWEITENVLQVFITYKFMTMVKSDDPLMEILEENNITGKD
jgi:hypothetical protein